MKLNPTCGNTSYTKSMDVNAQIIRVCSCTAATNSYCQRVAIFITSSTTFFQEMLAYITMGGLDHVQGDFSWTPKYGTVLS